jgi:hypothetical protein
LLGHLGRPPDNQAEVVQPFDFVLGSVAAHDLFAFKELAVEVFKLKR